MKLKKIVSGGQKGADRTGLEVAREIGLETGGVAPKGYRTEAGPDPSLRGFGLTESRSWYYPPRTRENVRLADATVWFGNIGSPGFLCTRQACEDFFRPFIVNPLPEDVLELADLHEVLNIAGNRLSTNPRIVETVRYGLSLLKV